MQRKEVEKNWNQLKSSVQKRWSKLTAEDLYAIDGMYDQLVGRLVKRYSYTRELAEKEIENWQPEAMHSWTMEERMDESPETQEERSMRKPKKARKAEIHELKHEEKKTEKEWGQHPSEAKQRKRKIG